MKKRKRVVITGIGPIASLGVGKNKFWEGILNKDTGLKLVKVKIDRATSIKFYLHKVKKFDLNNFSLDKNDLGYTKNLKNGKENRDLNFMIAAAKLALDDSRINYKKHFNNLGLIVVHENPCLEQLLWETFNESYKLRIQDLNKNKNKFFHDLYAKTVHTAYETQTFMLLFHIARIFNIHKYSLYINNACASGLYALEAASDMIRLEKALRVLVVGGDCPDVFKHLWFKMAGMYAEDGKIKPFSKNGKGFVLGEGATGLVLEDYETARKRNAHIYAEYLGGGFRLESWKVRVPLITGRYLQNSIKDALKVSGICNDQIDLICVHGVGIPLHDYHEYKAITDIFGSSRSIPIAAFKPYVGHNLGGSALIELAILLLSMQNSYIPPILNVSEITNYFNIDLVKTERNTELKFILKIASGFAGYNSAVILKKV